jgi:hypothetical protein
VDELSRIWFRTQCRDRLRNAQGIAFQDLFADLMELAFPSDFQCVRPYGNQGDQKGGWGQVRTPTLGVRCWGSFVTPTRASSGRSRYDTLDVPIVSLLRSVTGSA